MPFNEEHVLIFIESWASEALWRAHMDGAAMHALKGDIQAPLSPRLNQSLVQVIAGGAERCLGKNLERRPIKKTTLPNNYFRLSSTPNPPAISASGYRGACPRSDFMR